jgi:hypothetical protein
MPDPPATDEDSFALFKSLAEASSVSLGFAFVVGWSYLASYYRTFGLNPLELDLPLPVVCTTAVYVLYNAVWPILVIAAPSFVWIFFGHYLKRFRRGVTAVSLAFSLFAVSLASASLGRQYANDDMLADSNGLPNIAFSTRLAKTDQPDCVDHETYGSLDCKLLLHSKGTYYFFIPIPNPGESLTKSGNLNVYTLADPDVTGVHILRGTE